MQNLSRVLDEDIVDKSSDAMKYTTKPGGTARRADIWAIRKRQNGNSRKDRQWTLFR